MCLFVWLKECDLLTYQLLTSHEHEQTTNEQWPLLFIKNLIRWGRHVGSPMLFMFSVENGEKCKETDAKVAGMALASSEKINFRHPRHSMRFTPPHAHSSERERRERRRRRGALTPAPISLLRIRRVLPIPPTAIAHSWPSSRFRLRRRRP
jgi:hypothetical protein